MLVGDEARQFQPNALHRMERNEMRALTRRSGERLRGTDYTTLYENGVAVLDIHGPVFRHADTMATSGAMSTESVFHELRVIRASQNVKSWILHLDTPGGDATAADEVARFIHELSQEKHGETHIEGLGASLGYYWASATNRINQGRMALSGSIGVVLGVPIPDGKTKFGDNVLVDTDGTLYAEIVSSVSPLKRADVTTEEGHAYFLRRVNAMADVFVNDVAQFRGISAERLPTQYGDGGVYVGAEALDMGLCDEVTSFENVLERMVAADWERGRAMTGSDGTEVTDGPPDDGNDNPAPDVDPGPQAAQATDGGTDMSLKDRLTAAGAALAGNRPALGELPVNDVLAALAEQRPEAEAAVEEAALNVVQTAILGDHKNVVSAQFQLASLAQIMLADDAQFGGNGAHLVSYINAAGEEAMGTRAEAFEALLDALPTESLSDERVRQVVKGDRAGTVLADKKEKATVPGQSNNGETDAGSDDYDIEKMRSESPILGGAARQKKKGQSGARA